MIFPSNLIVATVPQEYIMEINQKYPDQISLSGVDGKLLDIISKALHFQYILKYPIDLGFGRKTENGSWTGMVGMLHRGEADIALGQLGITEERSEVADFINPYTNQDETFMINKPGLLPTTWAVFLPFGIFIWIMVLTALILTPIVYKLLLNENISYLRLVLQFYGSLLGKSSPANNNSLKTRTFIVFWSWFALIISNSYSAALLSFLTLPIHQQAIKNFEELSDAVKQGTHKCLAMEGLSVPDLHTADQEYLKYLGESIDKNGWYLDPSKMINENQLSDTTAIVDLRFMLQILNAGLSSDSYMISDDTLFSWKIAIAVRKDFCCKKMLNTVINRVYGAGLFDKFLKDEWQKVKISTTKIFSNDFEIKPLSIRDTAGPYILLLMGYLFSSCILIGEKIIARLFKSK
ncbi:uncharacterized protein CDAR_523621 [Caerostris darwini]|uniref:Ionotropic glutamate receptor L-glutamate and glycine-binding domain-containing protein n=1 Tax=Caerostris darwini TaxID=1538125 RepID=A0AAV4UNE9_9ARAC|nr:uncharacterized protein CDAR_523621 [Caerostris darwini]